MTIEAGAIGHLSWKGGLMRLTRKKLNETQNFLGFYSAFEPRTVPVYDDAGRRRWAVCCCRSRGPLRRTGRVDSVPRRERCGHRRDSRLALGASLPREETRGPAREFTVVRDPGGAAASRCCRPGRRQPGTLPQRYPIGALCRRPTAVGAAARRPAAIRRASAFERRSASTTPAGASR